MKLNAESLTSEEKRVHVEAYMKNNLTRRNYCEHHGLKLSSFKNWVTRYGHKQTSNFVPVVTTPQKQAIRTSTAQGSKRIEIFKRDCKVVLCDMTNLPMVLEIINGVISCN